LLFKIQVFYLIVVMCIHGTSYYEKCYINKGNFLLKFYIKGNGNEQELTIENHQSNFTGIAY